ncbi:MAG: glutathione S-transferase [Gammaproteobacteria bacterium]|jgi:glutathione S-transferase
MVSPVSASPQHDRVLWGVGTSRAIRGHWALHELQLDYRIEPVRTRTGDTQTPVFSRLNTRQKIPVLCDGEITITESAAIVTYLAEQYGAPDTLYMPTLTAQRARYYEWMSFVCMELDATSLYVLRRHEGLPQIYGSAPVASDAARAYFTRMIDSAADWLNPNQPYLLGDHFCGVDILMTTCLTWAVNYRLALPKVFSAYMERLISRPAYVRALAANQPS